MPTLKNFTPQRLAGSLAWRVDFVRRNLGYNLRLATRWRGQKPAVYLNHFLPWPIWHTYKTHPPLRYAPYPVAELCHWVDDVKLLSPLPSLRAKSHVYEIEHLLILPDALAPRPDHRPMWFWHRVLDEPDLANRFIARHECKAIVTFSRGLVEHFKPFLDPELWPKLDYVYPAYPTQPAYEKRTDEPFTILVIASRFTDKGVPEALRAYEILRQRHGSRVRMNLVSQAVPPGYQLPQDITVHNVVLMGREFKARMYRAADVLLLPTYGETAACFPEAYAFGVPVVTTRIHHGDEFVREGQTGYLIDTPIFAFSEKYATHYKTAGEWLEDLEAMRERGDLEIIVTQIVDRLEEMISGRTDMGAMRQAARSFHEECFSPQQRNRNLRRIYATALQ